MKINKNLTELLIGVVFGAISTFVGIFSWWLFFGKNHSFFFTLKLAQESDVLGAVIALGSLLNLGLFFLLLKFYFDQRAKGVLLWTLITAFFTMYLKFF